MLSTGRFLSLLPLGTLLASPVAMASPVLGSTLHPGMVSSHPAPQVAPVEVILWPAAQTKYAWGVTDKRDTAWTPLELSEIAEDAFEKMAAAAKAKGWDRPDHMAVIYSAGDGLVMASSVRAGGHPIGKGSHELCSAADPHSCAEQHALGHVKKLKWNLGSGSQIALYGRIGTGSKVGDVKPCERPAGQDALEKACKNALKAKGLASVFKGRVVQ